MRNLSLYVFVALSQAIVLVLKQMNISVGAIGGLAVIATGYSFQVLRLPILIVVIIALAVGLIAGAINGLIIVKSNINSFIITLSTLFVFTGMTLGITKGVPFVGIPESFKIVGQGSFFGIPIIFLFLIGVLIIFYILFKYTIFGRRFLATGENIKAARLSGVNVNSIIIAGQMISGLIAALSGMLYVSRIGSAQPTTGQEWLIFSFAIAIIGGTSLSGGSISILGILIGGLVITVINNLLILLRVDVYFLQTFFGLFILLAIFIDRGRSGYSKEI